MVQCILCEDWLHGRVRFHLDSAVLCVSACLIRMLLTSFTDVLLSKQNTCNRMLWISINGMREWAGLIYSPCLCC